MNHLTNSKGIIIMSRTITAATLVVHYSWQLSDDDIKKVNALIPGASVYTLACLIIHHPKFTLKIEENSDGTFEIYE